jgi:hypothetical protein
MTQDIYSNDVETAAMLAREMDDHDFGFDYPTAADLAADERERMRAIRRRAPRTDGYTRTGVKLSAADRAALALPYDHLPF